MWNAELWCFNCCWHDFKYMCILGVYQFMTCKYIYMSLQKNSAHKGLTNIHYHATADCMRLWSRYPGSQSGLDNTLNDRWTNLMIIHAGHITYHGNCPCLYMETWWRHQMETFSRLLAICAGNSPVTGEFPTQRPVTRSFGALFDLRLKKGWVKNGETCDWRRNRAHYDVTVMVYQFERTNPPITWIPGARLTKI